MANDSTVPNALQHAAKKGDVDLVRELLPKSGSENPNDNVQTAMVLAARAGHARVVEMLVIHGADPYGPLRSAQSELNYYSSDDGINYEVPDELRTLIRVLEAAQKTKEAAQRAAEEKQKAKQKAEKEQQKLNEQLAAGKICKACLQPKKPSDFTCPVCGYTKVMPIVVLFVVAAVFFAFAIKKDLLVAKLLFIPGLLFLVWAVQETAKAIRTPKRYKSMDRNPPESSVVNGEPK